MWVPDLTADAASERVVPITPRVLAPILRNVNAQAVVAAAPSGVTLADLNAQVTASLHPELVEPLRQAVVQAVRQRWDRLERGKPIGKVRPFADKPSVFSLSSLDLSVRAFNVMSRFPSLWLRGATIADLLDVPQLGAATLVEVLAAYEALGDSSSTALDGTSEVEEPVLDADTTADNPEELSLADAETNIAPLPERVRRMRKLYDTGATLEEVARQFGVSRERVRQIFTKHGLHTRSLTETNALRRQVLLDGHRERIFELIDEGATARQVVTRLDIPMRIVQDILETDPSRKRLVAFQRTAKARPSHPKYSDEEIIECLRAANVELGGVLTTADYTAFARTRKLADGRHWPLHQTPANRFGSWRAALQKAGLQANPPSAVAGQRIFTREHCIDAILEVERDLAHPPTAAEYERAAAASGGALPSLATLRQRCGGWQHALLLAARFSQ